MSTALDTAQWTRLRRQAKRGIIHEHWGSAIGQLFVRERVTAEQHEAALRWGNMLRAYQRITGLPSWNPKTMRLGDKSAPSELDKVKAIYDEAYREERDRSVLDAFEAARALMDGWELSALHRLCLMDEEPTYGALLRCRTALDKLVDHWEIGQVGAKPGGIRTQRKSA